jgi:hypothetical protein
VRVVPASQPLNLSTFQPCRAAAQPCHTPSVTQPCGFAAQPCGLPAMPPESLDFRLRGNDGIRSRSALPRSGSASCPESVAGEIIIEFNSLSAIIAERETPQDILPARGDDGSLRRSARRRGAAKRVITPTYLAVSSLRR